MSTEISIDYEKVFQLFVSKDELRPHFMQPFKQDGRYYATDANSLIYLPTDKAELLFKELDKPNCDAVIPKELSSNIEINILEVEQHLTSHLIDDMVLDKYCTKCKSSGYIECDLGHEHECTLCKGEGCFYKPSGKKTTTTYKTILIDGVVFAHLQIHRLVTACKLLGIETITKVYGKRKEANVFKCGDATILVMPWDMDRDYSTPTNS